MSDGRVDERTPEEDKDARGANTTALGRRTDRDGGNEAGKHLLVDEVDDLGDLVVRLGDGLLEDVKHAEELEVAEEGSAGGGEGKGVADEEPLSEGGGLARPFGGEVRGETGRERTHLERDDGGTQQGEEQQGESVLPPYETRVEVPATRSSSAPSPPVVSPRISLI